MAFTRITLIIVSLLSLSIANQIPLSQETPHSLIEFDLQILNKSSSSSFDQRAQEIPKGLQLFLTGMIKLLHIYSILIRLI